jgi:putative transposase
MSTYTQILYQLVFRSKDNVPFLTMDNENMLFAYIAGILKNKSCHSYIVGGFESHIHIITHLHPSIAPANLIKDIKLASHKMILENRKLYYGFNGWQVGYGAFTYHISSKDFRIRYVENQREHHKKISFREEYTQLLKEHSINFMDDYLFT